MALVDSVPAGIYGREALTSLGLWDAVAPQVAQSENVRAALALVSSGEAPLGIVYGSDAIAAREAGEAVSVLGTFPADSHSPIIYPAALVAGREGPAAAAFLDHLASPEARRVWEAQGFTVLD
jgi:molybdate transport system substrate-binding protein